MTFKILHGGTDIFRGTYILDFIINTNNNEIYINAKYVGCGAE